MTTVPYITSDDAFMAASASGYWADVRLTFVDPDVEPMELEVTAVTIDVTEEILLNRRHFMLTVADLDAAAKRALDENLLGPTLAGYVAARDIDGPTLDAVIQIACFDGRLIFG